MERWPRTDRLPPASMGAAAAECKPEIIARRAEEGIIFKVLSGRLLVTPQEDRSPARAGGWATLRRGGSGKAPRATKKGRTPGQCFPPSRRRV